MIMPTRAPKQLDPDFRRRVVRPSYSPRVARPMPRPRVAASRSRRWLPMTIGALLLIISVYGLTTVWRQRESSASEADAAVLASSTETATPPKIIINDAQLSSKLQQILKTYPKLDTGVSVIGVSDDKVYDFGDDAAYYAASVSKLIAASDFLSHVQDGTYSMNTTIAGDKASNQLKKLIVDSDNTAWQGFINLLGHPELERFAKANGVTFDATENKLTSHDTAVLLKKLYGNTLLSKYHTNLLLGYMNQASSGQYLEAGAPPGAKVYQKAGWLSDRLHVAGIVTSGGNGYIVAIYSKVNGIYDFTVGAKLIAQVESVLNSTYISTN